MLGGGLALDVQYKTNSVILAVISAFPGDYNSDGTIAAVDYVVGQKNEGTTNELPNDPIGDTIDGDQYNQWRANFGQTGGSSSVERDRARAGQCVAADILGCGVSRRPADFVEFSVNLLTRELSYQRTTGENRFRGGRHWRQRSNQAATAAHTGA